MVGTRSLERNPAGETPAPSAQPVPRLLSLDVFRGATVAFMVLVNDLGNPSAAPFPLRHGGWNVVTPTDWVFPFFLFIVGVAIPYSLARAHDASAGRIHLRILRRAALLFLIGAALNLWPKVDLATARVFGGALQRIAICYFLVALLALHAHLRVQVAVLAALLVGYGVLMVWVPFPGRHPDPWVSWSEGMNLARFVDVHVLGAHMSHPGHHETKGIVSTLPALANTLAGLWAGMALRSSRPQVEKVVLLFVAGTLALVAGLVWQLWMPFNQALWTASYAVFTTGLALLFYASCSWLVDLRGFARVQPMRAFGANALLVFAGSQFLAVTLAQIGIRTFTYERVLSPILGSAAGSVAHGLLHVLFWWAVAAWLYRRRLFVKL